MFSIASKRFPRRIEITAARSWTGPATPSSLTHSLKLPLTFRTARACTRQTSTEAVLNSSSTTSPHTSPRPSDSPQPSGPGSPISDHEWNLRAGRAVHTLRVTMPTFFETGLISSVDPSPSPSSEPEASHSDSIYGANIRLSYSPPASLSLPSPFPKYLQVEGLPLYHASAAFVRHTLSAFNTDLRVELRKLHVRSLRPRHREISLHKGVSGKSRISGARNEWDIHSTYTLSPHTGLIEAHVVESIHPAPHVTFYDGLRAALARLAGVPVEVGREAGAGARGYDVGARRALQSVPLRQEITKTEKD